MVSTLRRNLHCGQQLCVELLSNQTQREPAHSRSPQLHEDLEGLSTCCYMHQALNTAEWNGNMCYKQLQLIPPSEQLYNYTQLKERSYTNADQHKRHPINGRNANTQGRRTAHTQQHVATDTTSCSSSWHCSAAKFRHRANHFPFLTLALMHKSVHYQKHANLRSQAESSVGAPCDKTPKL